MNIKKNLEAVHHRVLRACETSERNPAEIQLVAVSKTVGPEKIRDALACGISDIGENRVQEAWKKFQVLENTHAKWHLVGHLQRNKVKQALKFFDIIHSLDSIELAAEINKRLEESKREVEILIEVNTSRESSKFGVCPENAVDFALQAAKLPNIKITGLMTIGTFSPNPEDARDCFQTLRKIYETLSRYQNKNIAMKYLSMGMTNDFEVAIQEGANIIRVGRAIFGDRI